MVFAGYSGFLHYLQLASHELDTIGINVTKNEIQIQIHQQLKDQNLPSIAKPHAAGNRCIPTGEYQPASTGDSAVQASHAIQILNPLVL